MTSRGTASTPRRSTGTPASIWRRAAPASCGFWPEQVLDAQHVGEGQVAIVAEQLLGERLPADDRAAVDLGDLAQLVRPGRRAQVARQLGADEDDARDRHPLGGLEREQPAHPVADDDGRRAEPLERRDDVLGVRVEREVGRVRGLRPVVVAQVQRVAFPAAAGEVAEVALPHPRAGQLAVDEQQRLAPRAPLGQPRLDVEAAIVQLDLVLADRPAVDRRELGLGEDRRRGSGRCNGLTTRAG